MSGGDERNQQLGNGGKMRPHGAYRHTPWPGPATRRPTIYQKYQMQEECQAALPDDRMRENQSPPLEEDTMEAAMPAKPQSSRKRKQHRQTDPSSRIVDVEDHDFDHTDDFRQWFLIKWQYDSGEEQYTWEPMETFIENNCLPLLIRYFETVVKVFNYTDPETIGIEEKPEFKADPDDVKWEDENADCEIAEGRAGSPEDSGNEIHLIRRVHGYKLPPAGYERPKYYVEWMSGGITLQPSTLMEGALGDVANMCIYLSYSTHFPRQEWRKKRYSGVFYFRREKKYAKASEFQAGKYKYQQYFNTCVYTDGTVKHSLKPFPKCGHCGRGKPNERKQGRKKKAQDPDQASCVL